MIPEPVGYFAKPAVIASPACPDPPAPAPLSPLSPKLVTQAIAPAATPKDIKPVVSAVPPPAPTRRRGPSKVTTVSKEPAKPVTTSNQSNAKHMTARDRKRRQMHNASAMRSRIRLNETLDKMWKTIPAARRRKHLMEDFNGQDTMEDIDDDDEERVGRADKVEVGIDYILYLEKRVKELEDKVKRGH
jgi:hypothetical protein